MASLKPAAVRLALCATFLTFGPEAWARDAGTPQPNSPSPSSAPAPAPTSPPPASVGTLPEAGSPAREPAREPAPAAEPARAAEPSAPTESVASPAPAATDPEPLENGAPRQTAPISNVDFDSEPALEGDGGPRMGEAVGRVVKIRDGLVVLSRDSSRPLRPGDNVAFRDEVGDERIVGRVRRVNLATYQVEVQMNEEVEVGEIGYRSQAPVSARLSAPPLGNYAASLSLTLRPWLGLNDRDSGILIEGHARLFVAQHFRLVAAAEPASPTIGTTLGMAEIYVAPTVSFRLAEMGMGLGAGTANNNASFTSNGRILSGEPEWGVLITPILALGAEDGFRVRARTSAIVHSGRATFGSLRLEMEIPVAHGMRLTFGGGGGDSGYAYGELGFKMLVAGLGGAKSWLVHGMLGYGGSFATSTQIINGYPSYGTRQANGPYVGIGAEYRFGRRSQPRD